MTTYTFKNITLEHDREWRAWRRLIDKERIEKGDEVFSVHKTWLPSMSIGLPYDARIYREFRRPVPLPSKDDLVEELQSALCVHGSLVEAEYVHPVTGEETSDQEEVRNWLRALLPGYEEQLANIAEMKRLAERPAGVVEDWTTGKLVSISKSQDKRYTACGVPFVPSGLSKPEELEGQQPSPVPADGWRPIETAPKDGTEVLTYRKAGLRAVALWDVDYGHWLVPDGAYLRDVTHWQPLPPPPQEKGGEA